MDTLIAFDFGLKRIGVAVGNTFLKKPNPLSVIQANKNIIRFQFIENIINEWQPNKIIIGIPYRTNGSSHEMTTRCKRFANQIQGRFGIETVLVDERYSSIVVSSKSKKAIDSVSAAIILQQYFDSYELSSI